MRYKLVFLAGLLALTVLSACSSISHSESIIVALSDKQAGGIKAIRHLQRGDDQQCEIDITQKLPDQRDLNTEIWTVLVCKRLYQYTVTFEPQAEDRYKVTATRFLDT
ncbi:hypothetical protein [Alkalimarinus alittae]|uniref:Lipoprotein n=1 Tax=Alkalimarinus alittae TaxID=2961619 RepID=A0ABY6N396_9ALTE|nr:hypothetical protein [Alkalimarinus alittae]UZE96495.1 hypothetical protein NKI27_01730 [Alkalimarinus alittae]